MFCKRTEQKSFDFEQFKKYVYDTDVSAFEDYHERCRRRLENMAKLFGQEDSWEVEAFLESLATNYRVEDQSKDIARLEDTLKQCREGNKALQEALQKTQKEYFTLLEMYNSKGAK